MLIASYQIVFIIDRGLVIEVRAHGHFFVTLMATSPLMVSLSPSSPVIVCQFWHLAETILRFDPMFGRMGSLSADW
jgi:hypothetical protein